MSKDHIVPAGIIGLFSDEPKPHLRESYVFYYNEKDRRGVIKVPAQSIFYSTNEYNINLPNIDSKTLDNSWDNYESSFINLSREINSKKILSAQEYVTLLKYCAGSFVRESGFRQFSNFSLNTLFNGFQEDLKETRENSLQYSRNIQFNNYIKVLNFYHISIIHTPDGSSFILNYSGFCTIEASTDWSALINIYETFKNEVFLGELTPVSFIFPISKEICIKLTPRFSGKLPSEKEIPLTHFTATPKLVDSFNKEISSHRNLSIVGINEKIIDDFISIPKIGSSSYEQKMGMLILFLTEIEEINSYIYPKNKSLYFNFKNSSRMNTILNESRVNRVK